MPMYDSNVIFIYLFVGVMNKQFLHKQPTVMTLMTAAQTQSVDVDEISCAHSRSLNYLTHTDINIMLNRHRIHYQNTNTLSRRTRRIINKIRIQFTDRSLCVIIAALISICLIILSFVQLISKQAEIIKQMNQDIIESDIELQAEIMRKMIWNQTRELQEPINCANVQYLTCELGSITCGFGCILSHILQCLAHSHREGKTMILKNERSIFGWNVAWGDYLLPVSRCQKYYEQHKRFIHSKISTTQFICSEDDWQDHRKWIPEYSKSFLTKENVAQPTGWFLGILNGYLFRKFRPKVEAFFDERIKELFGEDKNEQNIRFNVSCHIRRTDKVSWGEMVPFAVREYVNEIDHFTVLKDVNRHYHGSYGEKYGVNVYLATDEPRVIKEVNERFGQYDWYYNDIGAETAYDNSVSVRLSNQDSFLNALFDIIMLSKADYFVGTLSSHFGKTVFRLFANQYVNPSEYVLSLDESFWCFV